MWGRGCAGWGSRGGVRGCGLSVGCGRAKPKGGYGLVYSECNGTTTRCERRLRLAGRSARESMLGDELAMCLCCNEIFHKACLDRLSCDGICPECEV